MTDRAEDRERLSAPIDMVLHCPACGAQHIDAPESPGEYTLRGYDPLGAVALAWTNPPHRSHLCHGCGHIWRPADVPTNGVAAVNTRGKNDPPAVSLAAPAVSLAAEVERLKACLFQMQEAAKDLARQLDAERRKVEALRKALNAMLTHMGMDEDEWNKPTFDQARGGGEGMSPWGRSDLMATAAVRYCLGRSTYIVGDCVDWLHEHWDRLDQSAKFIIRRDVEDAIARDDDARARGDRHPPLGMDMDRAEWLRARRLWAEEGKG